MTLGSKDIGIKKSEFVAKTQFLWFSDTRQAIRLQSCNDNVS